jgi:hypothetical protein
LIFISEVTVKLIDKKIGQMTGGLLCVGGRDLMWRSNPTVSNAVQQQIEKTLKDNGYNIYSGLLKAKGERDADVLIGVAMENIKANICYSVNGTKGSASLQLTWEVLDQKTNKSLYFSTYGASTISEFSVTGDPDLFVKAAEMATNNLLADKAFLEATRR